MPRYLVVTEQPLEGTPELIRLQAECPINQQVAPNAWMVVAEGVASKELGDKIFPALNDKGERRRHMIVLVTSYWGYHSKSLWEWMEVHKGTAGG